MLTKNFASTLFSVATMAVISSSLLQEVQAYNVVIMGDSFISGHGARGVDGNPNFEGPAGCLRSPTSWAAQVAQAAQADEYKNVACSGATIRHITEPRFLGKAAKDTDGNCPPTNPANDEYYVPNDEGTCDRMVLAQVHAITDSTDYVLLSIGANDIGAVGVGVWCFVPGLKSAKFCKSALLNAYEKMDKAKDDLNKALEAIEDRLPKHGRILLFHYPLLVQSTGYSLGRVWWSRETAENVDQHFRGLATIANWGMSKAASGHNKVIIYDKTPEDFATHEIHPEGAVDNEQSWFYEPYNGWGTAAGLPDSLHLEDLEAWLNELGSVAADFFHLNPEGHAQFALKVEQNLS